MDNKKRISGSIDSRRMSGIAIFSALAFLVSLVVRFPVMFLTFDAKDAVIAIASFIYGPISAIIISLVAALIELVTISSTGIYGFIMNFLSSAAFSLTASIIYSRRKTIASAIIGLYVGVAVVVAVMMGFNVLVTPHYLGVATREVVAMLPSILLPFNLAKALMNAAFAMFLYKPAVVALRRAGLVTKSSGSLRSGCENLPQLDRTGGVEVGDNSTRPASFKKKRTIYAIIFGLVALLFSIVIFIILKK